jgi:hypothetical protein
VNAPGLEPAQRSLHKFINAVFEADVGWRRDDNVRAFDFPTRERTDSFSIGNDPLD